MVDSNGAIEYQISVGYLFHLEMDSFDFVTTKYIVLVFYSKWNDFFLLFLYIEYKWCIFIGIKSFFAIVIVIVTATSLKYISISKFIFLFVCMHSNHAEAYLY